VNRIESCVFGVMLVAILVPLQGSGATCSSYTRITNAGLNGIFDGVVVGYEDDWPVIKVRFASVTSGNPYTCKEVLSWMFDSTEEVDQQRLNDEVRKAAILSLSLGYPFSGRISTQNGESRLLGAGVSR